MASIDPCSQPHLVGKNFGCYCLYFGLGGRQSILVVSGCTLLCYFILPYTLFLGSYSISMSKGKLSKPEYFDIE